MQILSRVQPARQEALLAWFRDCLFAESLGEREGSHAGVWLPPRDKAKIASAGLARPTVQEVLAQYLPQFRMFAEEGQSPELRRAAGELLAALGATPAPARCNPNSNSDSIH